MQLCRPMPNDFDPSATTEETANRKYALLHYYELLFDRPKQRENSSHLFVSCTDKCSFSTTTTTTTTIPIRAQTEYQTVILGPMFWGCFSDCTKNNDVKNFYVVFAETSGKLLDISVYNLATDVDCKI